MVGWRRWCRVCAPEYARNCCGSGRLGILTIAQQAGRIEFRYLRTTLDLTAGNLSQHLTVLERAGLITIDKGYEGKRARTWIQLTRPGKKALRDEINTLKTMINELEAPH
jgi:DNA-binding MarR family transcriptional regulator